MNVTLVLSTAAGASELSSAGVDDGTPAIAPVGPTRAPEEPSAVSFSDASQKPAVRWSLGLNFLSVDGLAGVQGAVHLVSWELAATYRLRTPFLPTARRVRGWPTVVARAAPDHLPGRHLDMGLIAPRACRWFDPVTVAARSRVPERCAEV